MSDQRPDESSSSTPPDPAGPRLASDEADPTALQASVPQRLWFPVGWEWFASVRTSAWWQAMVHSLVVFAITRAAILAIFVVAAAVIPAKNAERIELSRPDVRFIFSQADGGWYLDVALHGYDPGPFTTDKQANWAFFPLYPAMIRLFVMPGIGDSALVGILLSNLFSLAALTFLWKLTEEAVGPAAAHRAVFYLSAFPTSIFLSAISNMGLSLLLLAASLYFMLRQRWPAASLAGGLAVLTRGQAIFLVLPFTWCILRSCPGWISRLRATPYLLMTPFALGGFMVYMWQHTGNALAFSDILASWDRSAAPPWTPLLDFIRDPRFVGDYGWDFTAVNFVVVLGSLAALPFVFKQFGATIGLYTAGMTLSAISFTTLMAADRYILQAFPLFMLLAAWGAREWVDRVVSVAFLGLLGFWAALFANGYQPVLA